MNNINCGKWKKVKKIDKILEKKMKKYYILFENTFEEKIQKMVRIVFHRVKEEVENVYSQKSFKL